VTYTIRVHADPGQVLWAEVDELPGCFATGRDLDELAVAMAEAISMCRDSDPAPDCDTE
jgi:predicted RNase H-like HicB family nuclease